MLSYVPAEITRGCSGQAQRKRRFPNLTGPSDKNHFAGQILTNLREEVAALEGHSPNVTVIFDCVQYYSRRFSTLIDGKIAEKNFATKGQLTIERLRMGAAMASFLPRSPGYIEDGEVNLTLTLAGVGLKKLKAEVDGSQPSLTLRGASGRTIVEGKGSRHLRRGKPQDCNRASRSHIAAA